MALQDLPLAALHNDPFSCRELCDNSAAYLFPGSKWHLGLIISLSRLPRERGLATLALLGARATTSTATVTLKPSLSLLSPAIMSASRVDGASNKRGGRRATQHRFCHTIALVFICIHVGNTLQTLAIRRGFTWGLFHWLMVFGIIRPLDHNHSHLICMFKRSLQGCDDIFFLGVCVRGCLCVKLGEGPLCKHVINLYISHWNPRRPSF